ncbi:MAG TPA: hypothetical protein VMV46_19735 [Thermoanaerobaculia bacterium]|nr:hypothetical protein [Thermoanaerobaculia bacterium]
MSTMQLIALSLVVVLTVGLVAVILFRRLRTGKLRGQYGGAEYAHAVKEGGDRRHGETELGERAARVESFNIQPLALSDRQRFEDSWGRIQARFVDGPGGAVAEADQLLRDVMSTRGYPVNEFEQRAADISVDHPSLVKNYREAHETALRQEKGLANTEDLRQAMIHYRTLFGELVSEQSAA